MEALSKSACLEFLASKYIGRVGYLFQGFPEVVPVTYCFDPQQEAIISYSAEGHKIDCLRKNPYVSFLVDDLEELSHWKWVIAQAIFQESDRSDAKNMLHVFTQGVKEIIHNAEHKDVVYLREFSSKIENSKESIIYRLKILEVKGNKE